MPALAAASWYSRRDAVLDEPGEDVADAGLAGLVAEVARDDPVLDDAAHALDRRALVAEHDVADARAHDRRPSVPGSVTAAAGTEHVGVDVGDRDGRAGAAARSSAAASAVSPPARSPIGDDRRATSSSSTTSPNRGSSAAK